LRLLGPIVGLQVQRSSLKVIDGASKWYDPAPLLAVGAVCLSEDGVVGCLSDGRELVDVHNRRHASTKHGGPNGISLGFTAHYASMRAQFGAHLTDGLAGENILIQTDGTVSPEDVGDVLVIETQAGGCIRLEHIVAAEPCLPFTRYALRCERDAPQDPVVTESLRSLRFGRRGFYATYLGVPATVRCGDRVFAS
jgi:hypothetical protein